MKKTYTKPELFCEEYELSTAIAGNCSSEFSAYSITSASVSNCGYKMGPSTIFINDPYCDAIPDCEGEDGTFCYQTVNPASLAFSS